MSPSPKTMGKVRPSVNGTHYANGFYMSDELKHECAVAMVVLRKPPHPDGGPAPQPVDFGGTKL